MRSIIDVNHSRAARTVLAVAAAALFGWVWLAGGAPAGAHAVLSSSSPQDGARLAKPPSNVTLQFSESVTVPKDGVQVIDSKGKRVDKGAPTVAGPRVGVNLKSGLGDDGYVVTWRVISADSHPIRGSITFTVGDAKPLTAADIANAQTGGSDTPWTQIGAVLRILTYLGGALLVGGTVFLVFIHDGGPDGRRLSHVLVAAAGICALGALVQLPIQAALATGKGPWSLFNGVASQVAAKGFGWSIGLVATGALLAMFVIAVAAGDRRILGFVALPAVALVPIGFAVAGHTTTGTGWKWATGSDLIHFTAAAVWFGGLALLVPTWRAKRIEDDPDAATNLMYRFSNVAGFALLFVAATGTALAWREVGTLHALYSTTYGRVLMVKVAAVGVVALMGGYNRYRLVPRLGEGEDHRYAWRQLRSTIRVEALLLVGVLALTGVLVNLTPAATTTTTNRGGFSEQTVAFGSGTLDILVDPAQPGRSQLHLSVSKANGQPDTIPADQVTVRFELPSRKIGPINRPVESLGTGHYFADGSAMTVGGQWRITLTAKVTRFEERTGTAFVNI